MLREEMQNLKARVLRSKWRLLAKLGNCTEGSKIFGISAPSRASTLIHYCGLEETLSAVVEISGSPKIRQYMPGTCIPVLDEEELYKQQPPYAILFAWHLADELIPKIRAKGYKGEIILPI